MARYTVVKGNDSEAEDYLEQLQERAEGDLEELDSGDIDEEDYEDMEDSDTLLVLGDIEDQEELERLQEAAGEVPAVSERNYDNFQELDFGEMVGEALYQQVKQAPNRERALELEEYMKEEEDIGIVIHNNPDPDAMSSAQAFKELAEEYGAEAEILYSGNISHQENKSLKNEMELELTHVDTEDQDEVDGILDSYDSLVLLDTAPTNVMIEASEDGKLGRDVDVAIDHHEGWEESLDSIKKFQQIDTNRGSVAGMITDYYDLLDKEPSEKAATCLAHGIYSDTNGFDMGKYKIHRKDIEGFLYLKEYMEESKFSDIISSDKSAGTILTYIDIVNSLVDKEEKEIITNGTKVIPESAPEYVENEAALEQTADDILTWSGVETAIVYGLTNESMVVKGRNTDPQIHIGQVFSEISQRFSKSRGGGTQEDARLEMTKEGLTNFPEGVEYDEEEIKKLMESNFKTLVRDKFFEDL